MERFFYSLKKYRDLFKVTANDSNTSECLVVNVTKSENVWRCLFYSLQRCQCPVDLRDGRRHLHVGFLRIVYPAPTGTADALNMAISSKDCQYNITTLLSY